MNFSLLTPAFRLYLAESFSVIYQQATLKRVNYTSLPKAMFEKDKRTNQIHIFLLMFTNFYWWTDFVIFTIYHCAVPLYHRHYDDEDDRGLWEWLIYEPQSEMSA